jgi:glycosyltransferase involved in cell wall biosynthesis
MRFGEDADWYKRALEMKIPYRRIEEITLYVRRHGGNMTEGKNLVELNALRVFKKSLDRMRQPAAVKSEHLFSKPALSVVMPVFNAGAYLREAIDTALNQTLMPAEIIVVDDGSTDGSPDLAGSYGPPVQVIRQGNQGAAAARNRGIESAAGEYLAFLDADDLWLPETLKLLFEALQDDHTLDLVFGSVEQFISPELGPLHHNRLREELAVMPGFLMGAMMVRKRSYLRVGPLDEKLKLAEFIDWFDRAQALGLKFRVLDDVVLRRRIHTSNQGILRKADMSDYAAVARAALARRRAKGN